VIILISGKVIRLTLRSLEPFLTLRACPTAGAALKGEVRPRPDLRGAREKARRGAGLVFSEERFPLEVGNATEVKS